METKLSKKNGRYVIEIPKTIVNLYSLKDSMIFEIKANDLPENRLMINLLRIIK